MLFLLYLPKVSLNLHPRKEKVERSLNKNDKSLFKF